MKKILAHDLSNHEFKIDHLCSTDVADFEQEGKQDGDILVWNSVEERWNLYHGLFTRLKAASLLWCDTFDANGMQLINYGGAEREMHVEFFNGKAYAEIFVSKANNVNEPWDNWINATTNKIESYNLAPHNGLNYETAESSVCIAPEVLTSLLITAKTSYTGGINPDAIATTNHLSSANRAQFLDYFTGQIPGFEQLDTFDLYDTHLGYRAGSIETDEWLIEDSVEGTKIGAPRWGYRSSGAEKGAKADNTDISENNVLSIWVTNY